MKLFKLTLLALLVAVSINFAGDGDKYGKDLTLKEKVAVSELIKNGAEYDGKTVLIEGTVVGVCEKRGCWMDIAGEEKGEKIRVKVTDGEIVFPMEAKGKTAMVEGTVYSVTPKAKCSSEKEGKAECAGCSAKKTTTYYMLKGSGAEIK